MIYQCTSLSLIMYETFESLGRLITPAAPDWQKAGFETHNKKRFYQN